MIEKLLTYSKSYRSNNIRKNQLVLLMDLSEKVRNLVQQYDNNYYIHWTIVIAIYLITILFALSYCKEKFIAGGYNLPPYIIEGYTDQRGRKWHFQFYPSAESLGGDLYHRPDLANNIEELKKVCKNDPECRGFNTDGWFKKAITSQDQWANLMVGTGRGLYIKMPGIKRNSSYPKTNFPGTYNLRH